jgi:hypothetical protein
VTGTEFAAMLRASFDYWNIKPRQPIVEAPAAEITRGEACRLIYEALP